MDPITFTSPPKEYAEIPFWSWNENLDPAELRRQIGLMDKAGWGGFFMHSRVGLKTPYLGKRWMECVRVCVEEAARRGMGAWLYDEDKWPSGYAGGLAVVKPEHRAQALICLSDNKPALLGDGLAAFVADRGADGQLDRFRSAEDLTDFDGDRGSLVQFCVYTAPLGQPWFNGYTFANLLNPDAVRDFLQSTHAVYAREFSEHFQGAIPGIFTDEPAYLSMNIPNIGVETPGEIAAIPWFSELPAEFQRRWGYDLLPNLPALFYDTPGFPAVRYHFWRLVTERFVEAFSKQVFTWCTDNRLPLTGHYLLEDNLWVQTRWIGAAMPHYEYEHIPGIDKLARNLYTVLTVKQLDSVVCQLGKPRALCEGYGCSGQDFSLAGRKWIGDWLYVLGVNLNNPHLALYSMRGERKRDYPANLFYQQPWWPENRLIADYFTRLSYALSQGKRVVDILVLHPMASAWSRYRPDSRAALDTLNAGLTALEKELLSHQRDFHYGDELLMEKYARVDPAGPELVIGEMRYRAVIVPPSHTWSRNTLRLLQEFSAAGGLLIAVPPLPCEVEGAAAGQLLPASTRVTELNELTGLLAQELPFDVAIPGAPELWVHHRRLAASDIYFIANTDLETGRRVSLTLRGNGALEAWDAVSGRITPLPTPPGSDTILELDFPPAASRLLCLHHDQPPFTAPAPSRPSAAPRRIPLNNRWNVRLEEPNSLTLDTAAVKLAAGEWSEPLPILEAHNRVRSAGPGAAFCLRYAFTVEDVPPEPLWLAVETPSKYNIALNGCPVETAAAGWWKDISFRKLEAPPGSLRLGENEITLTGVFTPESELESIYLLGDFGVRIAEGQPCGGSAGQEFIRYPAAVSLIRLPAEIGNGDLVRQGFPFFSGRIRLTQQIHIPADLTEPHLQLAAVHAALVRAVIDGVDAGWCAWPPHRIRLGAHLPAGTHTLEIEVVGTLRNLLGPHHRRHGDGEGVGPDSFRMGPEWTDDIVLTPFGVGGATLEAA